MSDRFLRYQMDVSDGQVIVRFFDSDSVNFAEYRQDGSERQIQAGRSLINLNDHQDGAGNNVTVSHSWVPRAQMEIEMGLETGP